MFLCLKWLKQSMMIKIIAFKINFHRLIVAASVQSEISQELCDGFSSNLQKIFSKYSCSASSKALTRAVKRFNINLINQQNIRFHSDDLVTFFWLHHEVEFLVDYWINQYLNYLINAVWFTLLNTFKTVAGLFSDRLIVAVLLFLDQVSDVWSFSSNLKDRISLWLKLQQHKQLNEDSSICSLFL